MNPYFSYFSYPRAVSRQAQNPAVQGQNGPQRTTGVWTAQRAADPETPVQPVRPVTPVSSQTAEPVQFSLPVLREGADPAEMAVRMRMRPYEEDGSPVQELTNQPEDGEKASGVNGAQEAIEEGKCQTCEERKYQDGSDDMGVSYQTPTNIAPEQAASAVRGHEMEHVVREQAKAQREDRKVVSQSVTLHTEICPECGKPFISGGTTRTTTAAKQETMTPAEQVQMQREQEPFNVFA